MRAISLFALLCLTLCAAGPTTAQYRDPRVPVQIVKTDFFLTTLPYPKPIPPPMVTLDFPASIPTFPGMYGGPTGGGVAFDPPVPVISGVRFNYAKIRGENRVVSYTFRGAHLVLRRADDSTIKASCTFHERSDQSQFRTSCLVPDTNYPALLAIVKGNTIEFVWPMSSPGAHRFGSETYTIDP